MALPAGARALGAQDGRSHFDHHRFDNYSAWLDGEDRKNARQQGRALGYGYADPQPPPPAREEKPFYVLEPAFTSGLMVNRKYEQIDICGYKTEAMRADPYHQPNHLEIQESQHYMDMRRKSQNLDPREWKPDPKLAHVVTDEMVRQHLAAHLGETRANIDPRLIAPLFDEGVRPQPETVRELNVDLSCVDLPSREGGGSAGRPRPGARASAPGRAGAKTAGDWTWCTGGRKPSASERSPDAALTALVKSQSLPQMTLSANASTLRSNRGGSPNATFQSQTTRKSEEVDCRMRGGRFARDGWAGTFPQGAARLH